MNYSYYYIWKIKEDFYESGIYNKIFNKKISIYNLFGEYPYNSLAPRMSTTYDRIDRTLYHKDALIKNLESGKYDVWFNKLDWEHNPYEYESYRLPTDEELTE